MSASTQLNLLQDELKQPLLALVIALAAIGAAVIVFNSLAGAEAGIKDSAASGASSDVQDSLDVQVQSSTSSSSDVSNNQSSTSVTVNGQAVPVDETGSVDRTIISEDGQSTVKIKIDNQAGGPGDESL